MDEETDWYEANLSSVLEDAVLDEDDLPVSEERFEEAFAFVLRQLRSLPGVPEGRDPVVDALKATLFDCRTAVERRAPEKDPFRAGRSAYLELFS